MRCAQEHIPYADQNGQAGPKCLARGRAGFEGKRVQEQVGEPRPAQMVQVPLSHCRKYQTSRIGAARLRFLPETGDSHGVRSKQPRSSRGMVSFTGRIRSSPKRGF